MFMPPSCEQADNCPYVAEWSLDESDDLITFKITAEQEVNEWTGIGFSDQPAMV
jgi:hypothetical protein